ncbi:MAG: HAMP domain-containing protein [Nitrospiraceae bacterium]|nr:MAG: HAMP domain-containing protein [Nitrospiraceae bacterium]
MIYSLKFKFIVASLLIVSVIMSITTWKDIKDTRHRLLEGQREKAKLLSQGVMYSIHNLMLRNRWNDLQSMVEDIVTDSTEIKELRIFLPDSGEIVTSSEPQEIGDRIYASDMQVYTSRKYKDAVLMEKNGSTYASKLSPIHNKTECQRCHDHKRDVLGVLDLEVSLAGIDESIRASKKKHLEDTLIIFLILSGGILLVVGILIDRPITNIIHTIETIEKGDLTVRMEDGNDEFGIMARSFNSMLDSVAKSNREVEKCHSLQMERAAKLASLGEIISGIAHEIKNPLAGISCAVQVFQSELEEGDDRKVITSEILNHIKRLDNIVKGLLNYARPIPPQMRNQKISEVLDKAVFFVYPEAKKHNVTIETHLEEEIPDILMDSDQMQQVFLNLMINAVQAMPDGGNLKIVASESDKFSMDICNGSGSQLSGHKAIKVIFEDNGHGIEPEMQKSIFDPFITKKSRGTGLGLSISQRIVREHGGNIVVSSEVNKGTTFTVYLPETSDM